MASNSTSYLPGECGNPRGRPKGSRNKASVEREKRAFDSGLSPLDFMLELLGDEEADLEDRKWAAEKAAPYIHPRIACQPFIDQTTTKTHEDWLGELEEAMNADPHNL